MIKNRLTNTTGNYTKRDTCRKKPSDSKNIDTQT